MFVLGFLGFCVPLLLAYHAFYENQLSVDFGTVEEDHVISVLTPAFGDALGLDNGSILPFSDEGGKIWNVPIELEAYKKARYICSYLIRYKTD